MPDRYLREALLLSDKFNALDSDAQNVFLRLLLVVDDYGCFDGRVPIIAASAFPTGRTAPLPLDQLYSAEFLVRYSNAGKPYVCIMQWGEGLRGWRKFPAPPICNDREGIKYRGVYGRYMNWVNPRGSDPVSVLLDAAGRPVAPQPPEWRRVGLDWMPKHAPMQSRPDTTLPVSRRVPSPEHPEPDAPVTTPPVPTHPVTSAVSTASAAGPVSQSLRHPSIRPSVMPSFDQSVSPSPPTKPPDTVTAPPATAASDGNGSGNGKIELSESGEWRGLSEAQRLRWQDMFPDLRVPEQLQRAGEWLLAHDEERTAYSARGELGEYLIRWLLREARGHQ